MFAPRPGDTTRNFLAKGFRSFTPAGKPSRALAVAGSVMAMMTIAEAATPGPNACAPGSGINAVDTSSPVNANFLANIKNVGIGTVIRYYDWPDETLRGKTLTPNEVRLIGQAHLKVAVVFQHHNDKIESFLDPTRGTVDAKRSLELAQRLGQPKGSTIYFGVDGIDSQFFNRPEMRGRSGEERYGMSFIKAYFQQADAVLSPAGYKVGVYGSGLVCKSLMGAGLAEKCWLSNAKGWPGYAAVADSHLWSMKQSMTISAPGCFGIAVDPNVIQPGEEEKFGAWSPGNDQPMERRMVARGAQEAMTRLPKDASPPEDVAATVTASRARTEKLEYEQAMAFAGVKSPAWEDLTDEQRETFRKETSRYHHEMQEFGERLHMTYAKP